MGQKLCTTVAQCNASLDHPTPTNPSSHASAPKVLHANHGRRSRDAVVSHRQQPGVHPSQADARHADTSCIYVRPVKEKGHRSRQHMGWVVGGEEEADSAGSAWPMAAEACRTAAAKIGTILQHGQLAASTQSTHAQAPLTAAAGSPAPAAGPTHYPAGRAARRCPATPCSSGAVLEGGQGAARRAAQVQQHGWQVSAQTVVTAMPPQICVLQPALIETSRLLETPDTAHLTSASW